MQRLLYRQKHLYHEFSTLTHHVLYTEKVKAENSIETRKQHQATDSDMWKTLGPQPKLKSFTECINSVGKSLTQHYLKYNAPPSIGLYIGVVSFSICIKWKPTNTNWNISCTSSQLNNSQLREREKEREQKKQQQETEGHTSNQ